METVGEDESEDHSQGEALMKREGVEHKDHVINTCDAVEAQL